MSQDITDDREQRIRERAYAIWIEEGRPEGRADDHWRMANDAVDEEDDAITPLTDLGGAAAPLITPNR